MLGTCVQPHQLPTVTSGLQTDSEPGQEVGIIEGGGGQEALLSRPWAPDPPPPEEKAAAGDFLSPMSSGWINLSALRRTLAELGEAEEATGSGRCRRVRLGRGVKSLSQKSGDRGGGLRERLLDRMVDHFWRLQLPL